MRRFWKRALRGAVEFLFPRFCLGCGRYWLKNLLCPDCRKSLNEACREHCHRKEGIKPFGTVHVLGPYGSEPLKTVIHKTKYHKKQWALKALDAELEHFIGETNMSLWVDGVVAVPLHVSRLRARGFNQAELLARIISEKIEKPVWRDVLLRRRATKPQAGIRDAKKRRCNVKKAFALARKADAIAGRSILLVDDVWTTGATLKESAITLLEGGAAAIHAFVLAG